MSEEDKKGRVLSVKAPYDPEPLLTRLTELLEKTNESYREAALRSGLDHYAVNRIFTGTRPGMPNCILLADHFEVNPNEILELAGWPRLRAFDLHLEGTRDLPPEAAQVALKIAQIKDDEKRKQVAEVVSALLKLFAGG
jgi:hypothetical protein